jgi:hypothetical protein
VEGYKKLALIGGLIDTLINLALAISSEGAQTVTMVAISLNLVAIIIPFRPVCGHNHFPYAEKS